MIIGFFGKGGSGKTTTCFRYLTTVQEAYKDVLAIDADHNMDLLYNLGVETPSAFVGKPQTLPSGIKLLAVGPHTEEVYNGDVCSHFLFRPFKEYLKERVSEDLVAIDTTAGMDSVGAGIPALIDAAVVCVEPTPHSIKVARDITNGLERTQTATCIVANKIQNDEQRSMVEQAFPSQTIVTIPFHYHPDPQEPLPEQVRLAMLDLHSLILRFKKETV